MMFSNIDGYMIVVKNDEASEYYSNYCLPEWKNYLDVHIFDAVTPITMKKIKDFKFAKYSNNYKYIKHNIMAEITDTEKACFCSHYSLWMECCFSKKPIMILEHDAYLLNPKNLWYDEEYGLIFYDNAAMGSYIIQPWFAEKLINYVIEYGVSSGPYGLIERFANTNNLLNLLVNKNHKKFKAASDQVMSKKYGSTIEHYCNLHPEYWSKNQFHKFIEIE